MFENQKSGQKTSSGEIGLNIRTLGSPKVGKDEVFIRSKRPLLDAAPVANVLWKLRAIRYNIHVKSPDFWESPDFAPCVPPCVISLPPPGESKSQNFRSRLRIYGSFHLKVSKLVAFTAVMACQAAPICSK